MSVITSWRVFSSAAEYTADPKRLAGTARQYSTNAMPQLARMTPNSGTSLKRKCPYQATVMNTLEAKSSRIGVSLADSAMVGMGCPPRVKREDWESGQRDVRAGSRIVDHRSHDGRLVPMTCAMR